MKKRRIIIFLTVCFLLLLAVIGVAILSRGREAREVRLEYRMLLEGLDARYYSLDELVYCGASVTNQNDTAMLGTVARIDFQPHKTLTVKDGEPALSPVPGRVDCHITVVVTGVDTEASGYRVCDIRMAAGERYGVHVGGLFVPSALMTFVGEIRA